MTGTSPESGAPAPKFWESFTDAGLKASPDITKYGSIEDLARAHAGLVKHMGASPESLMRLPADPNDAAAWGEVWKKLGRPDTPEGYKVELGENASERDKALGAGFAKIMHDAGATPGQVAAAIGWWNQQTQEAAAAAKSASEQAFHDGTAALKQEWGAAFDTKMLEVGRFLNRFGGPELSKELDASGLGSNPQLAKFLGKVLDAVAEPGGLPGLSGDAGGGNRAMTPAAAKAARAQLEGDPVKGKALWDRTHPQHAAVVAERMRYLEFEAAS